MTRRMSLWCYFVLVLLAGNIGYTSASSSLAIGQDVYEMMQESQILLEEKDYAGARAKLMEILEEKKLNNFEMAQTWSLLGNINFHQEDFDAALQDFEKVISYEDLPQGFYQVSLRTAAQLAFMQDKYDAAEKYAKRLIEIMETPDGEAYMLLAQVYFKRDNMQLALKNNLQAIEIERSLGRQIRENWLLVLNAIYFNLEDYASMEKVLKELIRYYPRDLYVKNLAAIYGQTERTERQLLLMEPLYDKGYLKSESELINLAQLMNLHGVPFKAALIMEKALEDGMVERSERNLELTAQSWQVAAESHKAAGYFAEAAKKSGDADMYVRLAQIYMNMYEWEPAQKALEKAIEVGDLKHEGNAHLYLGMVRFYQHNYSSAKKAFREAGEFDDSIALAEQWIAYVDQEEQKAEAAAAAETVEAEMVE